MPAEAGFGGCYVSIITLDNHKNTIKSNRDVLQNHDISLKNTHQPAFNVGCSCHVSGSFMFGEQCDEKLEALSYW